jgi:hypothetical protein
MGKNYTLAEPPQGIYDVQVALVSIIMLLTIVGNALVGAIYWRFL